MRNFFQKSDTIQYWSEMYTVVLHLAFHFSTDGPQITTVLGSPRPYITSVLSPPPWGPDWEELHITRTPVCHGDE